MLTPTHRLRADITQRALAVKDQRTQTRLGYAALRQHWHRTLGRPRNLVLGFTAGLTYGLMRSTNVKLPGRIELWRLARPVLLSTAMAWWARQQTPE